MHKLYCTGAGYVDGPLDILLPYYNTSRFGFGLLVLDSRSFPFDPSGRRDEISFLGPHWQDEWEGVPHMRTHLSVLKSNK